MTTATGPVIQILPVSDFAQMDEDEATKVLHERVILECLKHHVRLCDTPNVKGVFYITLLNEQALLSVEKVQELFAKCLSPNSVVRDVAEKDQIIAAMLLKGYEAHFSPDLSSCTFVDQEEEIGKFTLPCLPF